MMYSIVVILRHNTSLGGDLRLARREMNCLIGAEGQPLRSRGDLERWLSHDIARRVVVSSSDFVGVHFANVPEPRIKLLLQRSAFAQEVFVLGESRKGLAELNARLNAPAVIACSLEAAALVALSQAYVIESEGVLTEKTRNRLALTTELLLEPYATTESPASHKLRRAKKTTLSLSHDLHIYKAKFFPRMVRSLLNIHFPTTRVKVLDPYCGSGTALLEAALLGHDSVGVDLDPICTLISRAKIEPFVDSRGVKDALESFEHALAAPQSSETAGFPAELADKLRRRDRIDGTAFLPEIISEAATVASAVRTAGANSAAGDLIRTIASDSVTKKVRYRFVGVGNGRYTIEVVKQAVLERLREKVSRCEELCLVFPEIAHRFGTEFGRVVVAKGDATKSSTWPVASEVDVIVTSPPYLPASSGREHYAAARALAFYVLGMQPGEHGYYDSAVGDDMELVDLALFPEAKRLMNYLASDASDAADPQRDAMRFERKAIPTHHYLTDVRNFFGAAARSLKPDGVLLLVVAHHHVFYSHRRSEIEHVVSCRELYSEIALHAGLHLHEEVEMELMKSAVSRARPMAKDDYFESVLIFRRYPSERPATASGESSARFPKAGGLVAGRLLNTRSERVPGARREQA